MAEVAEKPVETESKTETETETATITIEKKEEEVPKAAEENGSSKADRSIIRQVEYYFSDANLNRDKFLLEQIGNDEEGWVPFTVLLTFKRLAALSTDADVIVDALLKSDEGLLEISEDRQKVRRHPERPIPEHNDERRKEISSRTAYAKGFPLDVEISELIEYFAAFEKVVNINMRKYLDKPTKTYKFKGSVFVTFAKKEQTQAFIEKDKILYKERELLRKWQQVYLDDKREEVKNKTEEKKNRKKKQEELKIDLPKGTVILFEGADEKTTRELIREAIEGIEGNFEIAFIDYSKGNKEGHIRLQEAQSAVKLIEKLEEKKLKLKDEIELTLRTLTEEEEKVFLKKASEHMLNRRNQGNKKRHGFGGSNRKRHGGGHHNDAKKKKIE